MELGFPVAESHLMKDLDAKLERWLVEEITAQISRETPAKEKAQLALNVYTGSLMKAAENALMSNLLSDYHAVFGLAHSFDVARHFASLPRRIGVVDSQTARTGGDALKYRIFQRTADNVNTFRAAPPPPSCWSGPPCAAGPGPAAAAPGHCWSAPPPGAART